MKGIIFTELIEMVEVTFGRDMMDNVFDSVELPSGGMYTSVGTYSATELLDIVGRLSELTGTSVHDLVMAYGRYLFGRFKVLYPAMFEGVTCALDFIESVETHIHVEVRKLYPDAELPSLHAERSQDGSLTVTYRSSRPLAVVAKALITGCIEHFGGHYDLACQDDEDAEGPLTLFLVTRKAEDPA